MTAAVWHGTPWLLIITGAAVIMAPALVIGAAALLADFYDWLAGAPGWKRNGGPGLSYLLPDRWKRK